MPVSPTGPDGGEWSVASRLVDRRPQPRDGLVHMSSQQPYPDVPARADYPAIEERILARWQAEDTFEQSVEQRPTDDAYVF